MYRWTAITLSVIAILTLSACGGWGSTPSNTDIKESNISKPLDNTPIDDTNISTPIDDTNDTVTDNTNSLIDIPLSCSISEVNVTIDSFIANIKCEDKDGINSATAKIKSDNDTTQAITLADDATNFDENITFVGLDNNTTYTIEASISSSDGKLEALSTQKFDYNITTLTAIIDTAQIEKPIPIIDTQAPTLSSTSQTFTSTVGEEIILETVTASDNIDSIVTVVQSGDSVDNNTVGTYEVVYTATDTAWNSSSITHTYIVNEVSDTEAPVLNSTNKNFTTTVWTALTLETVTATDNKDLILTVTQNWTVNFNTVWTYEVVYTATDTAWNSSSIIHTYNVTEVPDTIAPVLSSTDKSFTTTVWTDLTLEDVTATDNKDWALLVTQNWTVNFNTVWTYEVVYTATDTAWNSSSITHTYTVEALPAQNISITTSWPVVSGANSDTIVATNWPWIPVEVSLNINSPYTLSTSSLTFNIKLTWQIETQIVDVLTGWVKTWTIPVKVTWE